jgi:lipopolysaccharide export system protein LptA
VVHLAGQGWNITAGSFQVDAECHVVMAPFNTTLRTEKTERRFSAARAVLRLDRPVKDVPDLGERTVLSMQLTGGVKVRNDQGYLLDADKLDMTFSGETTMKAEGKVHFQSGDLPAGALCIRGDRLLLADTLWFAGQVTVQTADLLATADRGRYDPAKNRLSLEGDAHATLRRKGADLVEAKRIHLDLTTGKLDVEGASAGRE